MFKERRQRLLDRMEDNTAFVVSSPPELYRNGDASFPYRQSSDVFYLSGCPEPETTVILKKTGTTTKTIVFVRPKNKKLEIWDGRRLGVAGALEKLEFDEALPSNELPKHLPKLLSGCTRVYAFLGEQSNFDAKIVDALKICRQEQRKGLEPIGSIADPVDLFHELRLIKQSDEIQKIKKATQISAEAHVLAMKAAREGVYEYQISALLDFEFKRRGCAGPGYQSIVGAGSNATILHYVENTSPLKNGDLLLVDAGGEFDYYCADITRTFPVSGVFTKPQKDVYSIVLATQKKAIEAVKPGASLDSIHELVVKELTLGMIELGLLKGRVEDRIADKSYRRFYMHKTSHWLGMDVHDVGLYYKDGKSRPLEPGMVLTVEPGLYIGTQESDIPSEFLGIGIRIEDDILVTTNGHEVLTDKVPKEIKEIEDLCRSPADNLLI